MGIGGISLWQILIILLVIVVLFGGKKIRNMGSDLGEGLKGFKKAIKDDDAESESKSKTIILSFFHFPSGISLQEIAFVSANKFVANNSPAIKIIIFIF